MFRHGTHDSSSRTKHDVLLLPHVPAVCAAGDDLLAESAAAPGRHPRPDGALHHLAAGPPHHVHLQPVSWDGERGNELWTCSQRSPPARELSVIMH